MKSQSDCNGTLPSILAKITCGREVPDEALASLAASDQMLARKLMATDKHARATALQEELAHRVDGPSTLAAVFASDPHDNGVIHPIARATNESIPGTVTQLHPQLPNYATLSERQLEDGKAAGRWIDEYITFASQASPLTPRSFHEATALFMGSLAIARRVHLEVSTSANTIYPNLYLLFVGQSTRPRKTTGKRIAHGLLQEAGLSHFLLAERQTPEALLFDLSLNAPKNLASWREEERGEWLRERAIAAQRGWLLEEASHLLDSFNRDYTSGLLPIVLDLHDASAFGTSRNTISRGRERVEQPYLSIFGATTFEGMLAHMNNKTHWNNGLFARFAFILPDVDGQWKFWPERMNYPPSLVSKLKFMACQLLPMPKAHLETSENGQPGGLHSFNIILEAPLVSQQAEIAAEAWSQWEKYSKAVSYDMLPEQPYDVPARLYASYGRLGTILIKVAMILATFDAEGLPVRIESRHVYRAQAIVEGWRANLHLLFSMTGNEGDDDIAQRVKSALATCGSEWLTRRELLRKLNKTWGQVENKICDLEASGEIERLPLKNQSGPSSETYRLLR